MRVTADAPIETGSILYSDKSDLKLPYRCRVFAVNQPAREMLIYAMRWNIEGEREADSAERFFQSIALVCRELADSPEQLWLPAGGSDILRRSMDFIVKNVGRRLSLRAIAKHANASQRTIARHFSEKAGMTCSQFIRRARMIRAAELLSGEDLTVLQVSDMVGYRSVSSFGEAFRNEMQESPRQFRQRSRVT